MEILSVGSFPYGDCEGRLQTEKKFLESGQRPEKSQHE